MNIESKSSKRKELSLVKAGAIASLATIFPFLIVALREVNSIMLGIGFLIVYWSMVLFYIFLDCVIFSDLDLGTIEKLLLFIYYFALGSAIYITPSNFSGFRFLLGIVMNGVIAYLWVLVSVRLHYLVKSMDYCFHQT